jgi:tetratricopeptide (TPR) repeat protein
LPDYGIALSEAGDLDAANRVLDEAIELARPSGDRRSEHRAEIERAWVLFFRGVDGWAEDARRVAERAIDVFSELGDEGELAGAWILLGWVEGATGQQEARVATLRRAREHARASADQRREIAIWVALGGAMISARTSAGELLAFGEEEVAWARDKGIPFIEGDGTIIGAYVYPRLGRFDEAREALAQTRSIYADVGLAENYAETFRVGGQFELLAGDAPAAERELREALRLYGEMGDRWWSSTLRAQLAHALHVQGRDAEALELLDVARNEGVSGNYRFEVAWRTALAQVLTRRGRTAEGARLAREAVSIAGATDNIALHADVLVDLAEVLGARGEEAEAAVALEQAAALYEEKGYEFCADRARAALASLATGRDSASQR